MFKSLRVIAGCVALALREPCKLRMSDWLSRYVHIPAVTGASEPGPLDTSRVPPIEGLYDLLAEKRVHFFTLMKSARVGGTLFAICAMLHKIGTVGGPILWVDASNSSVKQLFRRELEPFLLACPPVAEQALTDREHWTSNQVFFRGGAFVKLAGSGSPSQLAGFQAEMVIINEGDKITHTVKGEAPPHELAAVRSKQFRFTRKIIENSTPTDEFGVTYRRFQRGSQHHCYMPCPCCGHMQRLTFFPQEVEVPFDEHFEPLPAGQVRIEKTGKFRFDHCRITAEQEVEAGKFETVEIGWDYDRVEAETVYECAKGCTIQHEKLNWMLKRYRWVQHNRKAPKDHISAQWWAGYSPFEHWGAIAKKFLLANGDVGALHDFWNSDLGLPFKAVATAVDESDIQRLVKASPRFLLRTLPFRPEILTMTIDVQEQGGPNPFWWQIWAWGIAWDQPGWPTVGALIDYGPAVSWEQLEELACIRPDAHGRLNEYTWKNADGTVEKFRVFSGLVDSGDQAQSDAHVYDFCLRNQDIFQPSKGGGRSHLRGNIIRSTPVYDGKLNLVWYFSDWFCQTLYRRIIKDRKHKRYLPADLGPEFFDQLTDEHTVFKDGRLKWEARRKNNHLGDCWKLQEVLSGSIEEYLDGLRVARHAEEEAAAAKALTKAA